MADQSSDLPAIEAQLAAAEVAVAAAEAALRVAIQEEMRALYRAQAARKVVRLLRAKRERRLRRMAA